MAAPLSSDPSETAGAGGVPASGDAAASEARAAEIVRVVLVEAVGSSFTPFVPVPFVDDYLFARLLRRIARKVIERAEPANRPSDALVKALVAGYLDAGESGLGTKALTAAARFVVRKVALVLDVKRSHDVFGESIAFALALDVAVRAGAVRPTTAGALGGAIHRAIQSVGAAALELLTRAGREAFRGARSSAPLDATAESSRFARVGAAIARQVDETRRHLDHLITFEISQPPFHMR